MKIRDLGRLEYQECWDKMREFCSGRTEETEDEIWFLQHPNVFTRGVSCTTVPTNNPDNIPIIDSDRGGQITFHGPGQLIAYVLVDLKRTKNGVKKFVHDMEQTIIDCLNDFDIHGERKVGAPGVYVKGEKIASLGIRVKAGSTYHGLSINVNMDKKPFELIDPCGLIGMRVVNISDLNPEITTADVQRRLEKHISKLIQR